MSEAMIMFAIARLACGEEVILAGPSACRGVSAALLAFVEGFNPVNRTLVMSVDDQDASLE